MSVRKIFTSDDIKILKVSAKKLKVSTEQLNIKTAVPIKARLGGFAASKGDGLPGMTSIWRGWGKFHQRLEFMEELI